MSRIITCVRGVGLALCIWVIAGCGRDVAPKPQAVPQDHSAVNTTPPTEPKAPARAPVSNAPQNTAVPGTSDPVPPTPMNAEPPPSPMESPFDAKTAVAGQKAWAEFLGKGVTEKTGNGMTMVLIPPGEFLMGSPAEENGRKFNEQPHRVRITKPFYLQTTEVTQGQWQAVMGTTPWQGQDDVTEEANCPATYVSWDDAVAFCQKLTAQERQAGRLANAQEYTLPTEAQWEYACRAGTTTAYSFGDDAAKLGDYAWYEENTWDKNEHYAHEVGLKRPNAWGLSDMLGNVHEWCSDWYDYDTYKDSAVSDPTGPGSGSSRVLRGGSWASDAFVARSAFRYGCTPDYRGSSLGFRVVCE